ncbi:glycosyltransferase family 2 protein [Paracoccus sp. TK19116]|uniref:Glycosyltransferase family 2 protein n=1 Tax=Paracoccus albicereus TaxID=2922394 RepID=A0ABT1MRK2_9RHOB|nr:glycosyltransferase family A protein [Paracoccus albicereus]MCQ0970146.1 glycosyltransferase family 2 protein [Paracoccus albicereus]
MITPTCQQIEALVSSEHFDPEWYRQQNPEVDALKMDPALHYLIYGHRLGRDPGPEFSTEFVRRAFRLKPSQEPIAWIARETQKNGSIPEPRREKIIDGASAVALMGDQNRAIALAVQYLPDDLAYTVEILRANAAVRADDDEAWLHHVNAYLAHFDVAPVHLKPGPESRFMRLSAPKPDPVKGGSRVSVIMPAWNASRTIEHAAQSILQQSWRNLELLIVDDRSDDDTWDVIQRIAKRDSRVRALRNEVNVGPYVSKNIALTMATGDWITGHDADDWALPTRIERHVRTALKRGLKASVTYMLRTREDGQATHLNGITKFCLDGVARRASISCLFERDTLRSRLGFWDSVRYGGDSEMIARAEAFLGEEFAFLPEVGMFCLNHASSLTNSETSGVANVGMAPSRFAYKSCWKDLYVPGMAPTLAYLPFPQQELRHDTPKEMRVPLADVQTNLDNIATARSTSAKENTSLDNLEDPVTPANHVAVRGPGVTAPTPAYENGPVSPTKPQAFDADVANTSRVADLNFENFHFRRADGKPFRILARGDCTSFRTVHLNKHLFPDGVTFIQAQKSPFIMVNEAMDGVSVTHDELRRISEISNMPNVLQRHYQGQADREILEAQDADLIIIDTWADLNFELWRSNDEGWTLWIHPKFLRDPVRFRETHTNIGRRSLEQSVTDAKQLVQNLRIKNPEVPTLILNQQIDYYPKMESRREYYRFGEALMERLDGSWFGGVIPRHDLQTADMDSCGPGNTLHFQGSTYLRMVKSALKAGMIDHFTKSSVHSATPSKCHLGSAAKPAENADNASPSTQSELSAITTEKVPFAHDNPANEPYPIRQIVVPSAAQKTLENYIITSPNAAPPRWTPVVIKISRGDYANWEKRINKRYNRVRMKRRSQREGHTVSRFNPRLYIPDMHTIHHSSKERSGGQMRGNYLRTIGEMGGAPTQYIAPVEPEVATDWLQCFGVFKPLPSHKQGSVEVGQQLLSYISVRRMGDIMLYSQLMGHDEHLAEGVMYHAHFHIVEEAMDSGDPIYDGVKFIMYGGIGNGGPGLWQWKRTVGFTPMRLVSFPLEHVDSLGSAGAD